MLFASSDGACLALGTLTGAVCVYGTSSMKKLYQVDNCHRSFVTRVEFLRTCPDDESVPKSCEHLVSISVDNQVYLHTISLNGKRAISIVVVNVTDFPLFCRLIWNFGVTSHFCCDPHLCLFSKSFNWTLNMIHVQIKRIRRVQHRCRSDHKPLGDVPPALRAPVFNERLISYVWRLYCFISDI